MRAPVRRLLSALVLAAGVAWGGCDLGGVPPPMPAPPDAGADAGSAAWSPATSTPPRPEVEPAAAGQAPRSSGAAGAAPATGRAR